MTLPNLELPIEDRHAAEWWRDQFEDLHHSTGDGAYEEARTIAAQYVALHFPDYDDE